VKRFLEGSDPTFCLRFKMSVANGVGRGRYLSLRDGYEMGDEVFGFFNAHKSTLNDRKYKSKPARSFNPDTDIVSRHARDPLAAMIEEYEARL
jgi:hypothetical protein